MVKHFIIWKLKDTFTEEEKKAARAEAKRRLESLNGKIEGLVSITVHTDLLTSSTGDMMLESYFLSEDALKFYQSHPLHLEAAGYVRSVVAERLCLDF